ncbi:MAG TPA: hypothetical protein VG013_28865, partial [Gemmataceae bacterium]|nr:hypothetical protein [Gemmataceae bacterium]
WPGQVVNWLVLAMAHHRLGHADEARRWLDKADQWIKKATEELPRGDAGMFVGMHVHDWLACLVLYQEAKAVLEGTSP